MKITALSILFCLFFSSAGASEFKIQFGIMGKNSRGRLIVTKETTCIPLYTGDTGFSFGFTIERPDSETYPQISAIHYLPTLPGTNKPRIFRNEKEPLYRSIESYQITLGKTDIPGDYRTEIYMDDVKYETINYEVVLPEDIDKCSEK